MVFLRPQVLSLTAFHKFHTTSHSSGVPYHHPMHKLEMKKLWKPFPGRCILPGTSSWTLSSSWHSGLCAALVSFSHPIFIYVLRSSTNTYPLVHICWCILILPSLPPSCLPVCKTLLGVMLRDIFPNRWAHKQGVRKVMEEQKLPSHRVSIHIHSNGLHHARTIIG